MFCENFHSFIQALQSRGFTPHAAENRRQAAELALSIIGGESVGCGGSMTIRDLGIQDALRSNGCQVFFHWEAAPSDRPEVFAKAASADWYLCSTNAITKSGELVNIDGVGNRVAGMFWGPAKVMLIIGKNKLCDNLDSAMHRIKSVACPLNARRLNLSTPCAVTGQCADCRSEQRICSVTSILSVKPPRIKEYHLILVDEELGY